MPASAKNIVQTLRASFNEGLTKPLNFRLEQLKSILHLLEENDTAIIAACAQDLGKSQPETSLVEIASVKREVNYIIDNLSDWIKPERPQGGGNEEALIKTEPYGVVLAISPWNYPFNLVLIPLAGIIAAGNCAIIKPSELAPASAGLLAKLIPKYLDSRCYQVILGGIPETTELLKLRYDYIFFTGGSRIGKIIQKAAAEFLTPVTLELGGKCPVYIDETVSMDLVAARIMKGKCLNAGQSCVAPDYVLCTKDVESQLIEAIKKYLTQTYGTKVKESPYYGRIINSTETERLAKLLKGVKVSLGGSYDIQERFFEPTVVIDIKDTALLMQEEIFGPILPIKTISNAEGAIKFINRGEKPLALYVFSTDQNVIDLFLAGTSSGGVCINDTIAHVAYQGLPFGGVGYSGMGAYKGKYSYLLFSHKKSVLIKWDVE